MQGKTRSQKPSLILGLTCNLAETIHNKWFQESGNKMICFYEATMNDMIYAFIQIINYRTWLRRGLDNKDLDSASLKVKVIVRCKDPKMLADAMKSYLGAESAKTRDCALEGFELSRSTKQKFNLHRSDKVNYSIPRPNIWATCQRIKESLTFIEHDVVYTTSMLETECLVFNWHIVRLHCRYYMQCQS